MILLLLAFMQIGDCDPNRPGLTYGWNAEWIFRASALDSTGLPAEGSDCWALEVLDWTRHCIDAGGPEQMAQRECLPRDTDRDGDFDLRDVVNEQRRR